MSVSTSIHLVATVMCFLLLVLGHTVPVSPSKDRSADQSVTGRPFGFARIVEDGISEVSQTLDSFDMWDIVTFCTITSKRSHSAKDFQSEVQLQVKDKTSRELIYKTGITTREPRWAEPRATGAHASSTQRSWQWRDVRVTLEEAIQWSHAGPGGLMDWLKVELSIALQDPQLPSGEPIWKFYEVVDRWTLGIGAVSRQLIYNPLLPPSDAFDKQTRPFGVNITSLHMSSGVQTA